MGKGQVLGAMERMYGRGRHMREQRKFEKRDGVGRRIREGILQRRRRGSKATRGRRR